MAKNRRAKPRRATKPRKAPKPRKATKPRKAPKRRPSSRQPKALRKHQYRGGRKPGAKNRFKAYQSRLGKRGYAHTFDHIPTFEEVKAFLHHFEHYSDYVWYLAARFTVNGKPSMRPSRMMKELDSDLFDRAMQYMLDGIAVAGQSGHVEIFDVELRILPI